MFVVRDDFLTFKKTIIRVLKEKSLEMFLREFPRPTQNLKIYSLM